MKFGKIYSEATGVKVEDVPNVSTEQNPVLTQLKIQWLSSEVTEDMFRKLNTEKQELLDRAVKLAASYSEHNNHLRIIDSLIRVDTLNKLINTYANIQS